MRFWRLLKQFPKWMLTAILLIGSTGLFYFWWKFNRPELREAARAKEEAVKQEVQKKAATVLPRADRLILADGDLYDVESGELIFDDWLKGDMPIKLWQDPKSGKIIAKHRRYLVRYNTDGTEDAKLSTRYGTAVSEDCTIAVYAEGREIWEAGIDWDAFKLINEQKVTTGAGIIEQAFLDNILLATNKAMVVNNLNQFLRVNLETGETTLTRVPMSEVGERRSPDGAILLGEVSSGGQAKLFAYDMERDDAKFFELGTRARADEFAWLNKDRAAFLIGGEMLCTYDREKNEIKQVMKLPLRCSQMAAPSPTGRYIFCFSNRGGLVADLKKATFTPIANPAQHYMWMGDDLLIYSRETQDTNWRGTWKFQIGGKPERISTEPYAVARNGTASVAWVKESGFVIFGTKTDLYRLKERTDHAVHLVNRPCTRILPIAVWTH